MYGLFVVDEGYDGTGTTLIVASEDKQKLRDFYTKENAELWKSLSDAGHSHLYDSMCWPLCETQDEIACANKLGKIYYTIDEIEVI